MKNVVITGAGRGIGLALTREFLKAGDRVLATFRDRAAAEELFALQKSTNNRLMTAALDVADDGSLGPLREALAVFGAVDILVNNAGVIGGKANSLQELDLARLEHVFQVNTLGPIRVTRTVLPHLRPDAVVASITSLMGSIADNSSGGYYDYRMSKAALNMFNRSLARELTGRACIVLHPGWVRTAMGGEAAPVTPEESARGLHTVIRGAGPRETGKFFDYSGRELPW